MLSPDHPPAKLACPFVVFTDLDGTLLDHHTYNHEAALPALTVLHNRGIPWMFNTSKTLAELKPLAKKLNNTYPIIYENGAGIAFPPGYTTPGYSTATIDTLTHVKGWLHKRFGQPRHAVIEVLTHLAAQHQFLGFFDMTIDDIVAATGLNSEEAARAAQREYTEPLLWKDSQESLSSFKSKLKHFDLHCLEGGRFLHVMSPCDKGSAMLWLAEQLPQVNELTKIIALGDSANDIAMLEKADIAVVVRSPVQAPPLIDQAVSIQMPDGYGPSGWNQAILGILRAHDSTQQ